MAVGFNYLLISGTLFAKLSGIIAVAFQLSFDFWSQVLSQVEAVRHYYKFQLSFDFWERQRIENAEVLLAVVSTIF